MTAVLIYLVLPAATFITGGLLGAWATLGIGRGVVVTIEDKPFVDEWRDEIAETPYCAGMETDIVQAIRLSDGRPTVNAVVALSPDQIARVVAIASRREDHRR